VLKCKEVTTVQMCKTTTTLITNNHTCYSTAVIKTALFQCPCYNLYTCTAYLWNMYM